MAFTVACRNKKTKGCDWKGALGDIEVKVNSEYLVLHYAIAMYLNNPLHYWDSFQRGTCWTKECTELNLIWAMGMIGRPYFGLTEALKAPVLALHQLVLLWYVMPGECQELSGTEITLCQQIKNALIDVRIDFSHCKWHFSIQHKKVLTFTNTGSKLLCILSALCWNNGHAQFQQNGKPNIANIFDTHGVTAAVISSLFSGRFALCSRSTEFAV